jgi:hypothetical protein
VGSWPCTAPAGTRRLADVNPGERRSLPGQEFAAVGSVLFFPAEDPFHGRELWALPLDDGRRAAAIVTVTAP